VHVDYDTQVRTVKKSGLWFKELLAGLPDTATVAEVTVR
jgi:beta-glucosidase/6-phospho-beta-glucosidase/beta-galactosidase